jgi:phosphoribosyl-dephospho-CoA transferase
MKIERDDAECFCERKLLTDEQKELFSLMLPVYGAIVKQNKTAEILNVSLATLYRMREQGIGAGYKKLDSKSKNGTVVYPLQEIVRYMTDGNTK